MAPISISPVDGEVVVSRVPPLLCNGANVPSGCCARGIINAAVSGLTWNGRPDAKAMLSVVMTGSVTAYLPLSGY
jgi:hypothetical protein